jgi:thiol-disulfide isomerase/thioredoxin
LKFCLSNDTIHYTINKNKDEDYQFALSFPYMFFDGYTFDKMIVPNGSSTKINILFDKQTFFPKYYLKELSSAQGSQPFIAYFNNYKKTSLQEIVATDSIPVNFHIFNLENIEKEAINKQAYNFKLKKLNGDSIELNTIENKYILLEFSTLGCGACRLATPHLIKLKEDLKNKAFDLFVIDVDDHSNTVQLNQYIEKEKINYSYLLDGKKISLKYQVSAFPTFFLIDKDKKIIDMTIGFNEDRLKKMIEKL